MTEDIKRISDPADPRRCQGSTSQGQCLNVAMEGCTRCIVHGGNRQADSIKQHSLRNYLLSQWQGEVEAKLRSPDIKSLRDEISILRLLLESRLNKCTDTHDLILQSGPISDLIIKIEKLVASCHRLETAMKYLMDKQQLLSIAKEFVSIISDELVDQPDKVNTIANRVLSTLSRIGE